MALSPKDLEDSQVWLKEANELEATIDSHLQEYYPGKGYQIPALNIDKPRAIVQKKIEQVYLNAGWILKFVPADDASQTYVFITEKSE